MIVVNYTEARTNLKRVMDKATDDPETILITRKGNRNILMLSEEVYNNLIENLHLVADKANFKWLSESRKQ